MFSKLGTKLALRKAGLPSNALDFPDTGSKDPNAPSPFANPFANMKIEVPKALVSWQTPVLPETGVQPPPVLGGRAVSCAKLRVGDDGRSTVVCFLRFCGCPFAEKAFLELRRLANKYPNIRFVAVSHCSQKGTERWLGQIGGAWSVQIVIDEEKEVYALWGLGMSNSYYLLNPWTQMAARKLGNEEGIWTREVAEGGNRWVVGGAWAVDSSGTVKWGGASKTADDIPNLIQACEIIGAR